MTESKIPSKAFATLALICILGAVVSYWQNQSLIAGGLAIVAILCIVFFALRGKDADDLQTLFRKKRTLVESISEAEKRFLNRSLDDASYRSLIDQKQKELVAIEAKIDVQTGMQNAAHAEELQKITSKNRHRLKQLLDQKAALVEETHFGEQKYLRREMEETAFFELRGQQQARLLEIEILINQIESEDAATQVIDELRLKLAELDQTNAQKKQKKEDEMAEEIFEQSPKE